MTTIRSLREKKNLSQKKVRLACGLTYSVYVRIEEGSGKTTPEEIERVLKVLESMEPGTRKLGGRTFKDPAKQEALKLARASAADPAMNVASPDSPPKKAAPRKAAAPRKKPAARSLAESLSKKVK